MSDIETGNIADTYETKRWCANHVSGTKYYDALAIWCEQRNLHMLVTHWGEVGKYGQVKIEHFSSIQRLLRTHEAAVNVKEKRGYTVRTATPYLNGAAYNTATIINQIHDDFGRNNAAKIINALAVNPEYPVEDEIVIERIKPEPPQPEPDRGENWGAW